ncbi:MAG TPA: DUF72 domain-containing protein [Vicinamibacterales bacterium]|nr:DUF72 domain-containing protein [Vicinamibacterales bacterium]
MTPSLRIGTSGWNYPTGRGTWNGIFYPPARTRPKGFDELAFYASHFNTVEVNSTFYGQPRPSVCRGWAERTPRGFEFSVKLYQKFTHPRMYEDRVAESLVPERADGPAASVAREWLEAVSRPNQADLDEFRRGIEPLVSAGKLGALLTQFPPSFKDSPKARTYLSTLLAALADYRVAVELRHRSWSDHIGETLGLLNEFQAAWVQIDEPKFSFSIRQNYLPNVHGFYYMRLHGRNAAQWWKHAKSEDRYDYLYSADELREFSSTADAARHLVKKVYLYANNHYSAKSVANAAMIKHQLGDPVEGEYSPEFIARFPELAGIVRVVDKGVVPLVRRTTPGRTSS